MFVFWVALSLLVYVYVGYPLLAWLRASCRRAAHDAGPSEPTVTVIVVAHNEAQRIGSRLENLLALDYPREKLEIVLASDGSTDGTVERARQYEEAGVQVRAFDEAAGQGGGVERRRAVGARRDCRAGRCASALRARRHPCAGGELRGSDGRRRRAAS